ncbi:MAG: 3-oxoacyl-[acyl-carrier-protein] reductase [Candidatus Cloacimonas sp.]|nr:3-oxoacyl-[acyl-carrier-protein] reductase [Candidatus Cloacimonadota bacterium]
MRNFENKVTAVTGSARGIGYSIAEAFAKRGAISIILDINKEDVDLAVNKITEQGFKAHGYQLDVTNNEVVEQAFKQIVEEHGRIDVLINNAGITRDTLVLKMSEEDWDRVLDVNLKGTFISTQKASRYMLKQRDGVIINVASVIGISGNAGQANYAASKGGVIAFTKSTAKEFASRNIRVNAIAPGFIETEMTAILPEGVVSKYLESIPLKRMGSINDVANLCLFLASDEASYITGQTINVDGGLIT